MKKQKTIKKVIKPLLISVFFISIALLITEKTNTKKDEIQRLENIINDCNKMIKESKSYTRYSYEEMWYALEMLEICKYKELNFSLDLDPDLDLDLDLDLDDIELDLDL